MRSRSVKYCPPAPCDQCPFTRGEHAVRVLRARAEEIAENAIAELKTRSRPFSFDGS